MVTIKLTVTVPAGWADTDKLQLMIGSENAANLAASTPVGGTRVAQVPVGSAQPGDEVVLTHALSATDKCATLPVGVVAVDEAGNVSAVTETTVQMADLPAAVGRPDISSAAPGSVTLTWAASPDV